jgi:CheY-like chemotaxis protein
MDGEKKTIRLLMVDDEKEFREAARSVLGRRGFEVREAGSGEEALEAIGDDPPDLVLLDLRMEGLDGIATLKRIRDVQPRLPVIILTGHGGFDDAVAGIKLEIVDFVQKPVDMQHLAERIRRLLLSGNGAPLREKTIGELMVPVESYRKLYDDQPLEDAIGALHDALFSSVLGRADEKGHRSVLVFDRREEFVGIVRVEDVLGAIVPSFLRDSPYASFFTGMFLAQSKLVGRLRVAELAAESSWEKPTVELEAPLMEAVNLMVSRHVINLQVMSGGGLVGVLRDKDLLVEIARSVIGR